MGVYRAYGGCRGYRGLQEVIRVCRRIQGNLGSVFFVLFGFYRFWVLC